MLNKEKIRWMTRASIFEKREGRVDFKRNEYFFSDYVRLNLLKSLVGITVAYILLTAVYMLYKIEDVFAMLTNMQFMVLVREIVLVYVILLIIYAGLSIIYYAWQYQMSHKRIKRYYRILRHIERCGEQEEK